MKVHELFAAMADLVRENPNAEVLLSVQGGPTDRFDTQVVGTKHKRTVTLWGDKYQTREVGNAYGCNDDRYSGRIFLIEVGELSE
jgi:hypothetical protein